MPPSPDRDLESLRIARSQRLGEAPGRRRLFLGLLGGGALLGAAAVAFVPGRLGSSRREVEVATVVRQEAESDLSVLTAGGYIVPRRRIDVASKVSGRVEEVRFEKGDVVRRGQVLARLDDREQRVQLAQARANRQAAQARLDEALAGSRPEEVERARASRERAESNLRTAELALGRARRLQERGVFSRQLLDDAQNAYRTAQAELDVAHQNHELARLGPRKEQIALARAQAAEADASVRWRETQLENLVIRAPVDGTVLDRTIEKGEMVTTGFFGGGRGPKPAVASLADLRELDVELDINESDIAKIRVGQPASVSPDSYPDRKYRAGVREVAPEANRQKATIQVKVAIAGVDAYLRPETNAKVTFLEAEPRATVAPRILVPRTAVVAASGGPAVYLLEEGRARRRPVRPGHEISGQVEIVDGLAGGERLIIQGLDGIADGEPVVLRQP